MSTIFYMIRHGQTDWNKNKLIQGRIDIPLNEEGKKQAIECANVLLAKNITFDIVYSSPLSRAIDTTKNILSAMNIKMNINIDNDLTEREFGLFDGKPINQVNFDLLNTNIEGIENNKNLQERAIKTITKICENNIDKKILIVTHSQFIKGLITSIDKNYSFSSLVNNLSINIFEYNNNDFKIINLNEK